MSAPQTNTITAMINQLPSGYCLICTRPCQAGNRISRPINSLQAALAQCALERG
ncbi:hypothetical protein D3C76_1447030 [compost metagenome]